MKDLMVRTRTFTVLTSRLVVMVLFAALLSAVPFHAALAATAPSLGSAGSFAVLSAAPGGGGAVTCNTSVVNGVVGSSGPSASVVGCTGVVIAPVPDVVLIDFNNAYDALAISSVDYPCTGSLLDAYTNTTLTLTPGVYCSTGHVTFTNTTLTLQGGANAVWIFKIGAEGGYLTGTNFSVVMKGGGSPCNVYWRVAQYATMTDSDFVGTILAGADITVTRGTFNGDALAKAAVTLTNVTVTGCEQAGHQAGTGCNQGVGNGPEGCDPGNSNQGDPSRSNDEPAGTAPGNPGRKGGNGK
jgi:hypothetical protein